MNQTAWSCIGIAIAGASAALARYGSSVFFVWATGSKFPYGTLTINILGAFLLGWLNAALGDGAQNQVWRLIIGVGFLGTFTTFSTMMAESNKMMNQDEYIQMAAYLSGSIFLGLLAVRAGMLLGGAR